MNPFNRAIARLATEYADYHGDTRAELFNRAVTHFADTVMPDDTNSDDMQYDGRDHDFADHEAMITNGDEWYKTVPTARDWIKDALANFGDDILYDRAPAHYSHGERGRIVSDPIARLQEVGVYMEASAAWLDVAAVVDALAEEIALEDEQDAA